MQRRLKVGDLVRCVTDQDIGLVIGFESADREASIAGDPICLWFLPDYDGSYTYSCPRSVVNLAKPKHKPIVIGE
jgi:hypothetical protein